VYKIHPFIAQDEYNYLTQVKPRWFLVMHHYISIIFLLFSAFNVSMVAANEGRVVKIGSDPWCPFVCVNNDESPGFMVEVAQHAMALYGYKVEHVNINWARAKQMVRSGELDGIVGTSKETTISTPYEFPKTPLGFSEICFFNSVLDNWVYHNAASLNSRVLGWINDYGFSDSDLDRWVKKNKDTARIKAISGKDGLQQRMIDLLLLRRIDTFTEDRFVIQNILQNKKLNNQIEVAGCVGAKEFVYVAFSREVPDGVKLASTLDKGVEALRKTGKLKSILHKYGISEQNWLVKHAEP